MKAEASKERLTVNEFGKLVTKVTKGHCHSRTANTRFYMSKASKKVYDEYLSDLYRRKTQKETETLTSTIGGKNKKVKCKKKRER